MTNVSLTSNCDLFFFVQLHNICLRLKTKWCLATPSVRICYVVVAQLGYWSFKVFLLIWLFWQLRSPINWAETSQLRFGDLICYLSNTMRRTQDSSWISKWPKSSRCTWVVPGITFFLQGIPGIVWLATESEVKKNGADGMHNRPLLFISSTEVWGCVRSLALESFEQVKWCD